MRKLALMAAAAIGFAGMSFAETVNFDGCEGKLVPGTNYYNLVDPRCKTETEKFQSTGAEETKRIREEELAAKDE
jgi:hypothetical protein